MTPARDVARPSGAGPRVCRCPDRHTPGPRTTPADGDPVPFRARTHRGPGPEPELRTGAAPAVVRRYLTALIRVMKKAPSSAATIDTGKTSP